MKRLLTYLPGLLMFLSIFTACTEQVEVKEKTPAPVAAYTPDSKPLYDSIVQMDSVLFGAYNICDLSTMASCFSEDIEFYHDKGGLMTSKDSIMEATKKYICGKVKRVLVPGSIEVYPIANYGAIEMGQHYFINNEEPDTVKHAIGKFVHTWKKENGQWRLTRVISLH